jgi:hypothetical protein
MVSTACYVVLRRACPSALRLSGCRHAGCRAHNTSSRRAATRQVVSCPFMHMVCSESESEQFKLLTTNFGQLRLALLYGLRHLRAHTRSISHEKRPPSWNVPVNVRPYRLPASALLTPASARITLRSLSSLATVAAGVLLTYPVPHPPPILHGHRRPVRMR